MKPLNTAERNSSFVYFLILFLITTALVVLAVFFGMQVPFQQNEKLEQQLGTYQSEQVFADNFSAKVTGTKILLDTVNRSNTQPELVDGKITVNLLDLNSMIDKDTSGLKKIYQDIVDNLIELQAAKKGLRDASNNNVAVGQYIQQVEDLRGQLSAKQAEADGLRMQLISLTH